MRVMFDSKLPQILVSYEAASNAALNQAGKPKFVVRASIDYNWSEHRFTVPMVDCK
jgi:hypothetical protein